MYPNCLKTVTYHAKLNCHKSYFRSQLTVSYMNYPKNIDILPDVILQARYSLNISIMFLKPVTCDI